MAQKIYDISVDLRTRMHVYPGDPRFRSKQVKSIGKDGYELHKLLLGNHSGTHVDAPAHFIEGGKRITDLPLELLIGRVRVVEIHGAEKVDVPELQKITLVDDFRILFKTRNSLLWKARKRFKKDYIYLTLNAAMFLAENGIKLIGFDYLSIERYGEKEHPVHQFLLDNEIVIVEGLNLAEVEEGDYEMACLPLKLKGLDAAPARVILRK
jgi:arylformamidase